MDTIPVSKFDEQTTDQGLQKMDTVPVLEFDEQTTIDQDLQTIVDVLHCFVLEFVKAFENHTELDENTLTDIECVQDGKLVYRLSAFEFVSVLCYLIKTAGCLIDEKLENFVSDIDFNNPDILSGQKFCDWVAEILSGGWIVVKEDTSSEVCSTNDDEDYSSSQGKFETQEDDLEDFLRNRFSSIYIFKLTLINWPDSSRTGDAKEYPFTAQVITKPTNPLALLPPRPSQHVIEAYERSVDGLLEMSEWEPPKGTCHGLTW